jgi:hypothetical protein
MHKIIDNVLPKEEFKKIKSSVLGSDFHWILSPIVTHQKENLPITASYYFSHLFWYKFYTEPQVRVFTPLLNGM